MTAKTFVKKTNENVKKEILNSLRKKDEDEETGNKHGRQSNRSCRSNKPLWGNNKGLA